MITWRRAHERGHFDHGWLDTWHTFSFADYDDPAHRGVSVLRVLNDDTVAMGEGFGTHPHRDMEILTFVLSGAIAHRDSMGHGEVLYPGDVQAMSAGTGVLHSEFNASDTDPLHFLQVWIRPARRGIVPRYAKTRLDDRHPGCWQAIAAPDHLEPLAAPIPLAQDARVFVGEASPGHDLKFEPLAGRTTYVHVMTGEGCLEGPDGGPCTAGDGLTALAVTDGLVFTSTSSMRVLLFDLP